MKKKGGVFEEGEKVEEVPLEFELDDFSEEDVEEASGDSASEEEIIDLVDVVDEGEIVEGLEPEEIAMSLDEDKLLGEEMGAEEKLDLPESIESDLDTAFENLGLSDEEEPELESLELSDDEEAEFEDLELSDEEDAGLEFLESELEGIADEKLEEDIEFDFEGLAESEVPEELPESEKVLAFPKAEESIGISEEKIEAIVTRVVQDVVERVTREAMTTVAEKLIGEAIDALKQSIESPSE